MNELIKIESINAIEVFIDKGLNPILKKVKDEIDAFIPDVSTQKGRDEIRSFAVQVRTTKTTIEKLGKKLVEDQKNKIAIVDKERIRVVKILDEYQEIARKPLTDFEKLEEERISKLESYLKQIQEVRNSVLNSEFNSMELSNEIRILNNIVIDDSWEEYKEKGQFLKEDVLSFITKRYELVLKSERDKEELRILREEKELKEKAELEAKIELEKKEKAELEEKKRLERDELIKKEAAEKARIDAETKAKFEAEKIEREKQIEIKKRQDAEKRAIELEERERINKLESEKREKLQKELAIKTERERVERIRLKKEADEKKRADDLEHRRKINNEACKAFEGLDFNNNEAQKIVEAIALNKIPNIKIFY